MWHLFVFNHDASAMSSKLYACFWHNWLWAVSNGRLWRGYDVLQSSNSSSLASRSDKQKLGAYTRSCDRVPYIRHCVTVAWFFNSTVLLLVLHVFLNWLKSTSRRVSACYQVGRHSSGNTSGNSVAEIDSFNAYYVQWRILIWIRMAYYLPSLEAMLETERWRYIKTSLKF